MIYRTDLTDRLIQTVFLLVRRPYSRQELAKHFGVSPKTVTRDVNALTREYPIILKHRGRDVYYAFSEDFNFEFPRFEVEELAALLLARKSISGIGITARNSPYAKYADSLLEKLQKSLPYSIQRKMEMLAEVYGSSAIPVKNFSAHIETIDRLASAALQEKTVKILYYSLNNNDTKWRETAPLGVYFDPDGSTLKLAAFDFKNDKIRIFSVDRVLQAEILEKKFTRPKNFSLESYLEESSFNGIHGEPVTVRLKATGVTARIFAERKFYPSQKIINKKQRRGNSPETITIEMRVADGRGLERFVLGWLPEIEVIAPQSLKEKVRQTILKGLRNF